MRKISILLPLILLLSALLAGCGEKDSADRFVGEQITAIKEKDPEKLSFLLEEGISESNKRYALRFPEELKDAYLSFLQEALKTVTFEVADARKNGKDVFTVQVYYTPVDVSATTKETCDAFLASIDSLDLNAETAALLEEAKKTLAEAPVHKGRAYSILSVKKTKDGFRLDTGEFEGLLSRTLDAYMSPYDNVCELLNAQDFLTAYLDASFKGEVSGFAAHTGKTEEEALAWYDSEAFLPSTDMKKSYQKRYTAALKKLLKQCVYSVGIPKKENGIYNYAVDVTVTPNNSLKDLFAKWNHGTYYSEDEVNRTLVELLEKYADAPSYGKETVVNVPLNSSSLMDAGKEGAEITNLAREILPVP